MDTEERPAGRLNSPIFCIRLEKTDDGPSWWATSDEVPGLSAAAGTLGELRERIRSVLLEEGISDGRFDEVLVGEVLPGPGEQGQHTRIAVSV